MSVLPPEWRPHRHAWQKMAPALRCEIADALRAPPPWHAIIEPLVGRAGVTVASLQSLVHYVALFGPDDPFLRGERSMDDPAAVAMFRALAEDRLRRIRARPTARP